MQVFRLVTPGYVDKVIAFDSLPPEYVSGVRKSKPEGFPRHWREFAPEFHVLEYKDINQDKEAWAKIETFVRKVSAPSQKIKYGNGTESMMLDKVSDMAASLATDSSTELSLEPENVPVIPIPKPEEPKAEVKEEPKVSGPVAPPPAPSAAALAPPGQAPQAEQKAETPAPAEDEKLAHTCEARGRGKLVNGCPRCDQLVAKGYKK